MCYCKIRTSFSLKHEVWRYVVTRNEDGFERPHLDALGGILKRAVCLRDNQLVSRIVDPSQKNTILI